VAEGDTGYFTATDTRQFFREPPPAALPARLGRLMFRSLMTVQGFGAFALVTLGVLARKFRSSPAVVRPLVRREIARAGLWLLPMFLFMSVALGFLILGQTASWLARFPAVMDYLGTIMVVVVVRELGPLLTAFLILARIGTANVVELGTARALGEVEALEALGIDPVHYLVVPRVVGMAAGVFALTVYLILGALISGYAWAFVQDVPLLPGEYFRQLAGALSYLDFIFLALKTTAFGFIIAVVTCYHGLAQPLNLAEISRATVRAVAQGIVLCVLVDVLFIVLYLIVR